VAEEQAGDLMLEDDAEVGVGKEAEGATSLGRPPIQDDGPRLRHAHGTAGQHTIAGLQLLVGAALDKMIAQDLDTAGAPPLIYRG